MQKFQRLLFPALALCFLLALGAWSLGRHADNGIKLRLQRTAPSETESTEARQLPSETEPARVDLNQASLEELMSLPGIGQLRAQRILDYRQTQGPFRHATDLMNVDGIGEAIFEKLRDRIYVEEYNENTDH